MLKPKMPAGAIVIKKILFDNNIGKILSANCDWPNWGWRRHHTFFSQKA